jgi:hypothetical protein
MFIFTFISFRHLRHYYNNHHVNNCTYPPTGNVLLFDIFGKLIKSIQMTDPNDRCFLLECRFWGDGFVAMASDNQIYVLDVGTSQIKYFYGFKMPHPLSTNFFSLSILCRE